ncbi:MAG: tetratricopeptide repeat protein [Vampirovibrionales bacterium]
MPRTSKRIFVLLSLSLSLHMLPVFANTPAADLQSDAKTLYTTALLYQKGRKDIPKDSKLANHYLILASQGGYKDAQVQLGLNYLNAPKGSRNEKEARYWLEKASQQGDGVAQFTLATLYQEGRGGSVRLKDAVSLLQASAKKGYIPAYTALGMSYATGKGVAPDLKQALRYYEFAAKHEEKLAQFKVGLMHQAGLGTSPNPVQGLAWLMLAEDGGFRKAKSYRAKLEAQSSAEDTQKARALKAVLVGNRSK